MATTNLQGINTVNPSLNKEYSFEDFFFLFRLIVLCDSGSNSLDRRGETKEKNDINQPPFIEEKVRFFLKNVVSLTGMRLG